MFTVHFLHGIVLVLIIMVAVTKKCFTFVCIALILFCVGSKLIMIIIMIMIVIINNFHCAFKHRMFKVPDKIFASDLYVTTHTDRTRIFYRTL